MRIFLIIFSALLLLLSFATNCRSTKQKGAKQNTAAHQLSIKIPQKSKNPTAIKLPCSKASGKTNYRQKQDQRTES